MITHFFEKELFDIKSNYISSFRFYKPFFQTGGYYRYIDGWRPIRPKWESGEPRMSQSCVYVALNGKWRTADCDDKKTSICMKSTGQTHIAFKN